MITLSHIVKRFGDATILNDISLSIPEGSVTALVGPSGGGKSTLLRSINLLEQPTSGRVQIGAHGIDFSPGRKVAFAELQKIRCETGMVFQNFQLFPHRTAIENVMEGLITVQKWSRDKAHARATELLQKVGMAHKADAWPSELSGGQQQRVAIARALAMRPNVMLFDEVTSALDPELCGEVLSVIRTLGSEHNLTMLMVTHQMGFARDISDRICFFYKGRIEEQAAPEQFFTNPQRERTQQFLRAVKDAD